MMRRALLFAIFLFALAILPARADDPTSLADYRRVVDQVIQLVNQSRGSLLDERPMLLKQAANLLGAVTQVQLDSGEQITINNGGLVSELNKTAEDSRNLYLSAPLLARIAALRAALADPPASATDSDLSKLHDIFNQPPFKQSDAESWLRQQIRRFYQWLDDLFSGTVNAPFKSPDLITLGGILVTILVVVIFVINIRRNLAAEAELKSADGSDVIVTSSAALSNAQKFAAAHDYRSAVRMLYLATLLILDERGRLRYDKSLTNREYLRAVKDEPAVADSLKPIIDTFDKTWYGYEPVTAERFGEYENQVEAIKRL